MSPKQIFSSTLEQETAEWTDSTQLVYLDFDGEETRYRNTDLGIFVDNVKIEDSGLNAEETENIVSTLNEIFSDRQIQFVTERPETEEYSTVYVGKTDSFDAYGQFLGLAETIDAGNEIKNDNAFVFLDSSSSTDEIISVISHEVSHIAEGESHTVQYNTIDDYALDIINWGTISSNKSVSDTLGRGDSVAYTFTAGVTKTITISAGLSATSSAKCRIWDTANKNKKTIIFGETSYSLIVGHSYTIYVGNSEFSKSASYDLVLTFTSSPDPTPDPTPALDLSGTLFVSNSNGNSTYSVGDTVDVSVLLNCTGSGQTSTFKTECYLDDKSFDTDTTALRANSDNQIYVGGTSPALTAGTHTIKVYVDSENSVDETNENNNILTKTITVSPDPDDEKPDLAPYTPSNWDNALVLSTQQGARTSSSSFYTTDSLYVSFAVANNGEENSSNFKTGIYLDGKLIHTSSTNNGLWSGYYTSGTDISIGSVSQGSHTLTVKADYLNAIDESDESNNQISKNFYVNEVVHQYPDLSVSSLTASTSSAFTTQPVTLNFTVQNNGNGFAGASNAYIYDGSDLLGKATVYSLDAGASSTYSYKIPAGRLAVGYHTLKVVLDGDSYVSESNEYNNTATCGVQVSKKEKVAISDYNKSGNTDTIQFVNGLVYVTYDNGSKYVQTPAINNITGWEVVEIRRDLTGDGFADIQIQSNAGDGTTWVATLRNDYLKNNCITLNYQFIRAYDNQLWNYIGSADFDGNGKAEVLLLQTQKGSDNGLRHVSAWATDANGKWVSDLWVGSLTSEWNIAGTADITGDGASNVMLRRSDGTIGYWRSAGTNDLVTLRSAGARVMITTGDFDGDGRDDILWQSSVNGEYSTWTNIDDGITDSVIGRASNLSGNWSFAGAGDYNHDGKDEILWCDTTTYTTAYGEGNKANFANLTVIA